METQYAGRHRSPATVQARRSRGVTTATLVRRPVVSTGVALALLGATAAGYARAGDLGAVTWASATTPQVSAAAQAQRAAAVDRAAYRQSALLQSNLTRSAAADAAQAAAVAAEAARIDAERRAAEARAARDAQRQAVVANAQQDPKSVARAMLAGYGWSDAQFGCLDSLWTKESGWRYTATNSSSGAYGIPQSLPASKMATVAGDYRTNPVTQITWGLQYIKASYGTPCGAWAKSQSANWY